MFFLIAKSTGSFLKTTGLQIGNLFEIIDLYLAATVLRTEQEN